MIILYGNNDETSNNFKTLFICYLHISYKRNILKKVTLVVFSYA